MQQNGGKYVIPRICIDKAVVLEKLKQNKKMNKAEQVMLEKHTYSSRPPKQKKIK